MKNNKKALIVDNDENWKETYIEILKREDFEIISFDNEKNVFEAINTDSPHIAIVHFIKDKDRTVNLISELKKFDTSISIIYITSFGKGSIHQSAIMEGAYTVINKSNIDYSRLPEIFNLAYNACITKRRKKNIKYDVFVLMPFAKEFNDIYQIGIKEPINKLGLKCQRVDEIQYMGNIIEEVFNCIQNSKLILADMSGQNANVFYEVGYAHAIKKSVILITSKVEDIPFDLQSQKHIIYGGNIKFLREKVEEIIKEFL